MSVLFFYTNKDFHFCMSFSSNIINYIITQKRLDTTKAKDIINHIQNVLVCIRDNLNKTQLAIIEQINHYKKNMTFKKDDLVFFSSKNIIIDKPSKKLNDKMFDSFKIIFIIDFFYKLKLFKIIKIYNVFHFKFLNFIIINLLSNQKNSFFKVIIVKDKEE